LPTIRHPFWRFQLLAGLCAVLSISIPPLSEADEHTAPPPFFAKVEGVTVTNSLIVRKDGGDQQQVVLAFLSIPTLDQPYGERSNQVLQSQLLNRRVSVRPIGEAKDDYVLGLVYVRDNNFNLDFLQRGHAWLDFFQISHPAWKAAQASARASGRGLYADPNAMHPIPWKNQMDNARRLQTMTNEVATDPNITSVLSNTFIGHRNEKTYVAASCFKVWSEWPKLAWVPITTREGAMADGYQELDCSSTGISAVPQ